jgi:hypothetical protein
MEGRENPNMDKERRIKVIGFMMSSVHLHHLQVWIYKILKCLEFCCTQCTSTYYNTQFFCKQMRTTMANHLSLSKDTPVLLRLDSTCLHLQWLSLLYKELNLVLKVAREEMHTWFDFCTHDGLSNK